MNTVIVLANGVPLTGWLEVNVDQGFDKASGVARITMSEQPGVPMPMKLGYKATVLIDGRPVITGHVHDFQGEHDHGSHTMTVTIRDQTQDMIDSTVGPGLKLKSPITLKQMAEQTLKTMGLGHIKVIEKIATEPFKDGEHVDAALDDRGFAFLDRWAQKRQVLLTTDGAGNLVIDRNQKRRGAGALVSLHEDSPLNNVLRSSFRNSDQDRHNKTAIAGQKSPNDQDFWESKGKDFDLGQAGPLQKNWGEADDTQVRPERKLHGRGAKGLSGQSPKKAAKWRSNIAKARGFQYTATVQGFYGAPGWLWWPGYIVPVTDAHWEIAADLLITDVRFKRTWSGGSTTEVSLTLPDGFSLDEDGQNKSQSRTSKLGTGSVAPGTYAPGTTVDPAGNAGSGVTSPGSTQAP